MAVTGRQLKVERVAAGVAQGAVARAMGLSRQTVWAIENAPLARDDHAKAYRSALVRLRDIATSPEAA